MNDARIARELVAVAKELTATSLHVEKDAYFNRDGVSFGFGWGGKIYVTMETIEEFNGAVDSFSMQVSKEIARLTSKMNKLGGGFEARSSILITKPEGSAIPLSANATFNFGSATVEEVIDYLSRTMKAKKISHG